MVNFLIALFYFCLTVDLLKSPLLVVNQELDLGFVELFKVLRNFVLLLLFLCVHPRDIGFDPIINDCFVRGAARVDRAALPDMTACSVLPSLQDLLVLAVIAILVFHELVQAPNDLAATHLPSRSRPQLDLLPRLREEAGCEDLLRLILLPERGSEQDLLPSDVPRALLERLVGRQGVRVLLVFEIGRFCLQGGEVVNIRPAHNHSLLLAQSGELLSSEVR